MVNNMICDMTDNRQNGHPHLVQQLDGLNAGSRHSQGALGPGNPLNPQHWAVVGQEHLHGHTRLSTPDLAPGR